MNPFAPKKYQNRFFKDETVQPYIDSMPERFTGAELRAAYPSEDQNRLYNLMRQAVMRGMIERIKPGYYKKVEP